MAPLTGTLAAQLTHNAISGELITLQDIAIPEQVKAVASREPVNEPISDASKPAAQSPESVINRQGEGLMRILRNRKAT